MGWVYPKLGWASALVVVQQQPPEIFRCRNLDVTVLYVVLRLGVSSGTSVLQCSGGNRAGRTCRVPEVASVRR